jgi:diguanylate cyclase (GGDEF)-like protein
MAAGAAAIVLSGPARSAHILVVDDDPHARAWFAGVLAPYGFDVSVAADGPEALAMIERETPDLILSDIHMPGVDGFDLVARIRSDERSAHVPVIFVSGSGEAPFKVHGLDCGANDYLTKPVDSAELLARVRAQLRLLRTYSVLREQAVVDVLTGQLNRRGVMQVLTHAFEQRRHQVSPLSVMVVDIDSFKDINDTFGHAMGDTVLRDVASSLADVVRIADTVGRLGGDEFVIVLPNTDAREAARIRARACMAVSLFAPDPSVGTLSISAGIATSGPTTQSLGQLMDAADHDMYRHKRAGKRHRRDPRLGLSVHGEET